MLAVDDIVNRIFCGHSLEILRQFPAESVHMSMTSPPYWGKRSYKTQPLIWDGDPLCEHEWNNITGKKHSGGTNGTVSYNMDERLHFTAESSICMKCGAWRGELGHEPTPELFIEHLCQIFDEVKRVLRRDGSCWVNLGETYWGSGGSIGHTSETKNFGRNTVEYGSYRTGTLAMQKHVFLQAKSQCGIPEMFVLEMLKRGWIKRNTILWHKPNAMPECISKDTRIFIKNELGFIKQIKIGNLINQEHSKTKILSPIGWVKIKNVWTKKVKKVTFNTGLVDTIVCSPDHRFLVVKDYHKNRKIKKDIESVKDFKTAETLINSSHRVVYADISKWFASANSNLDVTTIKSVEWLADFTHLDNKSFKETIKKTPLQLAKECKDSTLRQYTYKHTWAYASNTHNEYRRRVIRVDRLKGLNINFDKVRPLNSPKTENRYFTLDYDLGWLIGLYCAEGGFNQPRGFQGKITLGKHEQEKASKFINILKNKFNIEATAHKEKNCIVIQYSSATFYAIATYIVDGICSQKVLNIDYLINSSHEFRKGLWDGYIDGDGHKQDDSTWSSRSASEALIEGLQTVGTTLGKIMSIEINRETIDKRTHKKYTASNIWTNGNHEYDTEGNAYVRIKNLKISNEEEEFVDIEVEGSLFIIENGLISHNSSSDRFTTDFEHVFFFVKNNSSLYWTNEKTLKLVTKQPKTSVEGIDWEWRPCKRCGGTGFRIDGANTGINNKDPYMENNPHLVRLQESGYSETRTLDSFFEDSGEETDTGEKKQGCTKCGGTGRVRANLWTGHDYYFEQQFEPYKMNRWGGRYKDNENVKFSPSEGRAGGAATMNRNGYDCYPNPFGRNMRSVWTIKTMSFKGAHFAVYPEELITTPIKASCPRHVCKNCGMPRVKIFKPTGNYISMGGYGSKTAEHLGVSPLSSILTKQVQEKALVGYSDCGCGADYEPGIVLDPFSGSGTTALTALKLGRRFVGIDSNPEYVKMAIARIKPHLEQKKITDVQGD